MPTAAETFATTFVTKVDINDFVTADFANEKVKTEITDIDPNIELSENKGIENGEQLAEMYQADVDKQSEDKKDKEEKDEVI